MIVTMRIGTGCDVHAFTSGDHVMLGGVRIPHDRGVRAHSDGDVVIHALCDALLGAAGLGDIGRHFPDTDTRWRGAASRVFLGEVIRMLAERHYRVINADITLIAEAPRIGAHRITIQQTLADLMLVPYEAVNIKATTQEGMGFIGRGEGIAAQAVALIDSSR
jgi:2-C-methyl-D-erythritol 2,4-cyclodiphosphate synthase